jgi:flavin-binding protein dodecin
LPENKIIRNIASYGSGSLDKMTVAKVVELIGSSPKSWEDAKTVRGIKSVHVTGFTVKVKNNKIVEYRAVVKIAFVVERGP